MVHNSNQSDLLTILSGTTAFISVVNVQPIVSLIASLIAIISGLFAIRYYIKATKRFK
jgi:hypothetical protein